MLKKIVLSLILCCPLGYSLQADGELDSLKQALKKAKHDTTIGQIYNNIGMAYYLYAPDSAYYFWEKSLKLANTNLTKANSALKNAFLYNKAEALGSLGFIDHGRGNIDLAVVRYKESAEIFAQLKDTLSSATVYNNTANVYMNDGRLKESMELFDKAGKYFAIGKSAEGMSMVLQNKALIYKNTGNIKKAIELYNRSLKIRDSVSDSLGLGHSYYELGIIHNIQNDLPKAKELLSKSLAIRKKLKDFDGIGASLNELGMIYFKEKNDSCLWFFRESIKYRKQSSQVGLGFCYSSIGSYYLDKGMLDSALINFHTSLDYRIKSNEKKGQSLSYYQIGNALFLKGNIKDATTNAEKAYQLGKENNYLENINKASRLLSTIYKKTGDYKKSLDYYEIYKTSSDSLLNKETKRKTIESDMNFDFYKKTAADSIKAVESKKVLSAQIEKEKTQKYALYSGLALVLVFALFIFNRFKVTQKQKQIIELKEQETQKQNEVITFQKHIVEEKQKEILDSINYAKRIQQTLLAHEDFLRDNIVNHFVFFKPKDIVSGDFYWATKKDNLFYLAVCDSTGHGVPGAFMSLLNIGFLSEAINEKGITTPNEVFDFVRQRLTDSISKEGQKDGFDGILLCMNTVNKTISYVAAHNAPVIVSGGTLIELEADKMPVGVGERKQDFTLRHINYKQGDTLYLYTDGYADQFGGPKGKKFKYKALNELLASHSSKELKDQKQLLHTAFENWQGDLEQVDDVLIIGMGL
ncbi:MAG: tetratricopeptide repeat protein [Bacteroidota bacterium]|nr:tetratricopeptide repeat protein [Bacteroidota bacterium]